MPHKYIREREKNHMQAKVNHTNPRTNKMHSVKSSKILHKNVNVVIRGVVYVNVCVDEAHEPNCVHIVVAPYNNGLFMRISELEMGFFVNRPI